VKLLRRRRHRLRVSGASELGAAYQGQIADRQAAASRLVGGVAPLVGRIAAAPPGYLLACDSGDVARHCSLLEPVPAAGEVRVVVTPGQSAGEWHLDVASRDRPGLLATFTGVLEAQRLDVTQAVIATWADGGALEAFVVRSSVAPGPGALQAGFETAFGEPLCSMPVAGARVTFDAEASPLYTRCDVEASDQPGLLHALATAFASAGADVHAARVTTTGEGLARDRFDLSDRWGRKLDAALEAAIRTGVATGVADLRPDRASGYRMPRRTSILRKASNSGSALSSDAVTQRASAVSQLSSAGESNRAGTSTTTVQ
jgi:hypothetical protein